MTLTDAAQGLGVSVFGLTREAVQKAFREKAKTCHPDVGGSNEEMIGLNKAREILLKHIGAETGDAGQGQARQQSWTDEIVREHWARMQEEQRREQERKQRVQEEKTNERKRYAEGVKRSYDSEVEYFKKIIVEHTDNPAFWKAVEDTVKEKKWRLNYDYRYRPFQEYKKRYAAKQMYEQLFADKSTYQAVYRTRKKDGTQAGPYWYRVRSEKGKTKKEYVGMELPKSAMGEPLAGKRSEKCWQMAQEWAKKVFTDD